MWSRPRFIRFGREICGDLCQAERREWWVANGLGAYAAGTVAGTLTRRYHGLLIAPLQPPLGRCLVFAKADAWLELGEQSVPLCTNRWREGIVAPQGYTHIERFHLDGRMPVWTFAFGDLRLEQRIWLEPGANTAYVAFRIATSYGRLSPFKLRIKLLVNARDHHGNAEPSCFNPVVEPVGADELMVRNPLGSGSAPYTLRFVARGGVIRPDHVWYENFDLPVEAERGLPTRDHHLCVGECTLEPQTPDWTGLVASLEDEPSSHVEEAMRRFFAHDEGILVRSRVVMPQWQRAEDWERQLILSADSFLFARRLADGSEGESVIAGFPWFGDWGRDTMIALPGLTLATGRHDSARRILETFAHFVDRGMLPNVFPGHGEQAAFNSVDAALWYVEAWRAYVDATGDLPALRQVFPVLEDIIRWHREGTRYGIGMDAEDGLLRAGEAGVQLTWMDAKVGEWVVTPREGKPVEINALWFNAICCMAQFARDLGKPAAEFEALADVVRRGFRRFVDPATGSLVDVLDGPDGDDDALRPNQILAVSLPFSPLPEHVQHAVVRVCGAFLLTSYGLRTLAPAHPDYCPHYRGGVCERDGAYHQGTVWTWLLGHYALAEYRVTGDRQLALSWLQPLRDHLFDAGLGTVSEIFEAEAPHRPCGAPSQAWSVACVLEALWRLQRPEPADAAQLAAVSGAGQPPGVTPR